MASSLLLKPITSDLLTVEGQCIDPSKHHGCVGNAIKSHSTHFNVIFKAKFILWIHLTTASKNILGELPYHYCFARNYNRVIMSHNYFTNCRYLPTGNNDY